MKKLKSKYCHLDVATRLYGYNRPIIGLTGGIATGKSTVTKLLQERGLQVIDADQLVKSIYRTNEALEFIQNEFPEAWSQGTIDFPKLRSLFFHHPKIKEKVENFIYVRLPDAFRAETKKISDQSFFIYDVPLLFERELDELVDITVVVYAPTKVQLTRLMDRDGHVEAMAKKILDHQIDIEEKKLKADFIINNSGTLTELAAEVDQFLQQVLE